MGEHFDKNAPTSAYPIQLKTGVVGFSSLSVSSQQTYERPILIPKPVVGYVSGILRCAIAAVSAQPSMPFGIASPV